MVASLKKAIEKVEQLNEQEQEGLAKLLWDEIEWEATLKHSSSKLDSLAQEALDEYKRGKTKPLDL